VPDLAPLYPVSRRHLDALSTDIGIMQHAQDARPDPDHGYCTDDVARALLVDLLHQRVLGWAAVAASVVRNLTFLEEAFEPASGRFRNLRRADGTWLEGPGSEDANARALHALAETIESAPAGTACATATALFERALRSASRVGFLRPRATVLLACEAAVRAGMSGDVIDVYQRVANDLWRSFERCEAYSAWPWPEPVVTYENELPARALIVAGRRLGRPRLSQVGLRVLDWLIDAQTTGDGQLRTVGNAGWWPRGGPKARFDQQAISTTSLLLAAGTAYEATGSSRYQGAMEMAYGWFLGRNDAHEAVAQPRSGACGDGIGPAGVSRNQGAESTLMWLIALEHIRAVREWSPQSAALPREALAAAS
jgi:hypothetical protein